MPARCFQGAGHQRCRVHFARNLLAHVPEDKADMVASMFWMIFSGHRVQGLVDPSARLEDRREERAFAQLRDPFAQLRDRSPRRRPVDSTRGRAPLRSVIRVSLRS
jgi:transposase-like protein